MERVLHIQKLLLRSRRLPWLVAGLTLLVLAGTILLASLQLREKIREQIASRDGEILHAVSLMEYAEDVKQGLTGPITDLGSQLSVVLKSSQLKGVLGVRLFDGAGRFVETFPPAVREGRIDPRDLSALKHLRPVSHFQTGVRLSELFLGETAGDPADDRDLPLLEVNVPLHTEADAHLAGIAQFLLEGHSIAAEFDRLDRHLLLQGLAAFGAAGGILALAIGWAFRRLRQAHRLLAERTQNLLQANQELALAAKTSALGAVTAHLIHGLKNPLSGLQNFVAGLGTTDGGRPETDWQQAIASTRRMQNIINEVVSILREEEAANQYELTLAELVEIVSARALPLVRETGVQFVTRLDGEGLLSNRVANLVILILLNLVQNAVQATPKGKTVRLSLEHHGGQIIGEVCDQGPGIPAALAGKLFTPCRSTKEGGSGIGLALSKQLANHLGASLELKSNTPAGCVFVLALPVAADAEAPSKATAAALG